MRAISSGSRREGVGGEVDVRAWGGVTKTCAHQVGTWVLDSEACRPTVVSLVYLLAALSFVALHCLRGWQGRGLVAAQYLAR